MNKGSLKSRSCVARSSRSTHVNGPRHHHRRARRGARPRRAPAPRARRERAGAPDRARPRAKCSPPSPTETRCRFGCDRSNVSHQPGLRASGDPTSPFARASRVPDSPSTSVTAADNVRESSSAWGGTVSARAARRASACPGMGIPGRVRRRPRAREHGHDGERPTRARYRNAPEGEATRAERQASCAVGSRSWRPPWDGLLVRRMWSPRSGQPSVRAPGTHPSAWLASKERV